MLVGTVLLAVLATTFAASVPSEQFMHNADLDEDGKYRLYWSYNDTSIVFEAHVQTTGWAGLGISPSGDMTGADIVIGWIGGDGQVYFKDRYATMKGKPLVDPHQDWFLMSGKREGEYTVLKFTRLLDTKDCEHDLPITSDTLRVIWAYNNAIPESEDGMTYHGPATRGSKSINLLEPAKNKDTLLPASAVRYDFLNRNVSLPAEKTTYWCEAFKKPPINTKQHLVKYAPVIQKGNKGVVHHMILFACYTPFDESLLERGYNCYDSSKPDTMIGCGNPMALWAVGGEDFYFPPDVGFSLGAEGDPTYFILETHYDNPQQRTDIIDNSGMSLWYTPEIRKYDAGLAEVGTLVGDFMMIPPRQKSFQISGICNSNCTQAAIPPEGIKTFAYILHTHLAGRKIHVRQYRDEQLVDVLAHDDNYDFNYQQMRWLKKEKTIMPGDSLIVDCFYGSTDRASLTLGGIATTEEMCVTYIYYYPRSEFSSCQSLVSPRDQFSVLGMNESLADFDVSNDAPNHWTKLMQKAEWTPSLTSELQRKQLNGENFHICRKGDYSQFPEVPVPIISMYPSYVGPVKDRVQDCLSSNVSATAAVVDVTTTAPDNKASSQLRGITALFLIQICIFLIKLTC